MNIKEISLTDESAQKVFKNEHCNISADLAGILARAIIEAYKAELLKEVGEPVGLVTFVDGECYAELSDTAKLVEFDELFASDQVAAAIIKATGPMEEEVERLKTVPMKYRRMAFNAQLQDENNELRAQLAKAEQRVAEACAEIAGWQSDGESAAIEIRRKFVKEV